MKIIGPDFDSWLIGVQWMRYYGGLIVYIHWGPWALVIQRKAKT